MSFQTDPSQAVARSELVVLLQASAEGDRQAFAQLYDRTSAKLYGICLRLLGSEPEAQDVLQETYIRIWQKAERFDSARASPITWLSVLARNKAIDRLRQRTLPRQDLAAAADIPDQSPSAFELVQDEQDRSRLTHCLEELEERSRAMIRAAFLEGATYPELAARENIPLGTLKSWVRRGLQRLRGCLSQ